MTDANYDATRVVDLRSDTVTLPTEEMLESVKNAKLGDDVFEEDPTVKKLEEMAEETGLPIVIVEQRARRALEVGDYAYMMRGGVFTFEGQAADLLNHPQLTEMYLGAVEVHDLRTVRE